MSCKNDIRIVISDCKEDKTVTETRKFFEPFIN